MKLNPEPLLDVDTIQARVRELAEALNRDYEGRDVLLLAVLKGAVFFVADLARHLGINPAFDFIRAKSYEGTQSAGEVEFLMWPRESLAGRHVLIIEDILDTGRTTSAILERASAEGPASLALCVLLNKASRRETEVDVGYVGFEIDDHFVVGYGLDYNERYRELPAVHILE